MSTDGQLDEFFELVRVIENDFAIANAGLQNFEVPNSMEELRQRFDDTFEAHTYNSLKDASVITTILALMRMYDKNIKDRQCIPRAVGMLKNTKFLDLLQHHQCDFIKNNNTRSAHAGKIHYSCNRVICLFDKLPHDIEKSLRQHRNHYLAHSLNISPMSDPPKYYYFELLIDQTCPIVNNLIILRDGEIFDENENSYKSFWYKYSHAFWKNFLK